MNEYGLIKLNIKLICLYLKWGMSSLSLEVCKQILDNSLTWLLASVRGLDQGTLRSLSALGVLE